MRPCLLLAFLLTLGLATLLGPGRAQAQGCEFDCPSTSYVPEVGQRDPPAGHIVNKAVTRTLVRILNGATETCGTRIDPRYRIDCLRIYYLKVAERLPDTGDYLPVKTAMLDAAARLDAIVSRHLDETAPTIRPRERHKPVAARLPPVRPIKEAFVESAAAEAARIIEETELIIIRSGGDPARRTEHYTDIAAAVEDNLVVLRSA